MDARSAYLKGRYDGAIEAYKNYQGKRVARTCIFCGETFPQMTTRELEKHANQMHGIRRRNA